MAEEQNGVRRAWDMRSAGLRKLGESLQRTFEQVAAIFRSGGTPMPSPQNRPTISYPEPLRADPFVRRPRGQTPAPVGLGISGIDYSGSATVAEMPATSAGQRPPPLGHAHPLRSNPVIQATLAQASANGKPPAEDRAVPLRSALSRVSSGAPWKHKPLPPLPPEAAVSSSLPTPSPIRDSGQAAGNEGFSYGSSIGSIPASPRVFSASEGRSTLGTSIASTRDSITSMDVPLFTDASIVREARTSPVVRPLQRLDPRPLIADATLGGAKPVAYQRTLRGNVIDIRRPGQPAATKLDIGEKGPAVFRPGRSADIAGAAPSHQQEGTSAFSASDVQPSGGDRRGRAALDDRSGERGQGGGHDRG